jgi:carboxymethylenebutenolidase
MLKTDHLTDTRALLDVAADRGAPSRRQALGLALGVGYAAATLPALAQSAIKTSSDGLTTGEVTIDVAGFKMPAFRAQPAGKTGLPVVLVLSEIFGVHEYIADVARRLAHAGYLAIAPELFVRQGDAQSYGEMAKLMSEVIAKVPDAQVMGDLDATVAWAGANGGNTDKLGVTGFAGAGARRGCTPSTTPAEGGRGLVRAPGGPAHAAGAHQPAGRRGAAEGAGAGPVRRRRHRHPA